MSDLGARVWTYTRRVNRQPDLPAFPWDRLADLKATAAAHPDGPVDLSVGSPVDPTPAVAQDALAAAADAPAYPLTHGTPALRAAALGWLERRHGVTGLAPDAVLPSIGAKEMVGSAATISLAPIAGRTAAGSTPVTPWRRSSQPTAAARSAGVP